MSKASQTTSLIVSANLFRNMFNSMDLSDSCKKDIIEECEQFINSFADQDIKNAISFIIAGASCRELANVISEVELDG